jgi:HK97 family phage prohead protease
MTNLLIPLEIKAVRDNEIVGHGSVFGNVDLGGDIVLPGAFKRSLAMHSKNGTMPAMLWQHDSSRPIGIWTEASEDETGLMLKGKFADTQDGRDARTLSAMRAVRGLSIGFQLKDFDFDNDGNRLIKEADLWETSVVTFPMNPAATIEAVKSQFSDARQLEKHLREAGCSQKYAKDLVHDVMAGSDVRSASVDQREVDEDEVLKALRDRRDRLEAANIQSHRMRKLKNG